MDRVSMVNQIGRKYLTSNVENGEYSYVQAAGSKEKLAKALGYEPEHIFLDIRFENDNDIVVLVETKQSFTKADEDQLREYLAEERALHRNKKVICILANTTNNKIKVWQSIMDDKHLLTDETVLDTMEHYESLFAENNKQNNREKVLKNTYALNETLHKKDIDEKLRSQFVGTSLLYIKRTMKKLGITTIDKDSIAELREYWGQRSAKDIRSGIEETLEELLDGSDNKTLKIELLQKNVLTDQKVKKLAPKDWEDVLIEIVDNIYRYINTNSSEGQDILNLFFIAFNKYTGKADKNQAFTPDHITNFMCRVTGVDHTKRLFDGTAGSGSFLVQGMVLELADVNRQKITEAEKAKKRKKVVKENIYGIEIEDKAFGLCTTNMLIHGDGNSNIKKASLFDSADFIKQADPDIILMNPPYNAKPINIPAAYKTGWKSDAKEDPTKGVVFLKFISDTIRDMNTERVEAGKTVKEVKVAILLPVSAAIGTDKLISSMKSDLLEDNTLEAVFSLPNELFYPGANASACCMVFTLGKPHTNADGTVNKTFFGYYKEDGHKKKKNLGRIEQFDKDNNSIWKQIEDKWLDLYRNKTVEDGLSAMQAISGDDEWLCEAYMKTDYSKLCESDFQKNIYNYVNYLVSENRFPIMIPKTSTAPTLNIADWKEFRILRNDSNCGLFLIQSCKCGDAGSLDDGDDINYIGAKWSDNGVMNRVEAVPAYIQDGNCVIFICSGEGSAGYAIYMDVPFIGSTTMKAGYDVHIKPEIGLFIATVLCQEKPKYGYGRKWLSDRFDNTIIKLPAKYTGSTIYNDNGYEPDWQFMEDYIKALPYGDRLEG